MVHDRQKIAVHERMAAQGGWSLKLEHYLTTLLRKPGALAGSVALQQVPHLVKRLYESHFADSPKDFLELLRYTWTTDFVSVTSLTRPQGFTGEDCARSAGTRSRRSCTRRRKATRTLRKTPRTALSPDNAGRSNSTP